MSGSNRKTWRMVVVGGFLSLVCSAVLSPASRAADEYHVNAGGGRYVDALGQVFEADQAYVAGAFGHIGGVVGTSSEPIEATVDDVLYQTGRRGVSFSYRFDDLPVGDYEVRLFFMEPVVNENDERRFDVSLEGVVRLEDYDIQRYAGTPSGVFGAGRLRALTETLIVTVDDGQLEVEFLGSSGINAIVAALSVAPVRPAPALAFVDVAQEVGIDFVNQHDDEECAPYLGTGSAWADYDADGDPDLYLTNHGGPNRLYRNDGDGNGDGLPEFVDVATETGVADPGGIGHGAVFVDYDDDGDQDLFVASWEATRLYRNRLSEADEATFEDVTDAAGLSAPGRIVTASWADFDDDGRLDVYLARHFTCMNDSLPTTDRLYRNEGDGTFSDVTSWLCPDGSFPCAEISGLGFTAGWLDYDADGDPDLYLVNDDIAGQHHANVLWRNDGPGVDGRWAFTDVSAGSGADLSVNGMGLGVGDFDNDGDPDLAISNISPNNLLRNDGGTFTDISAIAGVQRSYVPIGEPGADREQLTWGTLFADFDNDGWLDLFYAAGHLDDASPLMPSALFHNDANGRFTDVTSAVGLNEPGRARNASRVDFDGDGFVDLLVSDIPDVGNGGFGGGGRVKLYHNRSREAGNTHHWLTVTVEGTAGNLDAIGTRITAATDDGHVRTAWISSGPTHGGGDFRAAHFGLKASTTVDLTVDWPSGLQQSFEGVTADQRLHLVEPSQPSLAVASSLDFGTVALEPASERALTLANAGTAPLSVTDATTSGAGFDVVGPDTPFTIAPGGGQVDLTIRFTPPGEGSFGGELQIVSDDPDSPVTSVLLSAVATVCDGDGVCEFGESCDTCSSDCASGTVGGADCGNGVCEIADGEDCLQCPEDCDGRQNGRLDRRFCCGSGAGSNPVGCDDARCTDEGDACTEQPVNATEFCCGDAACDFGEGCDVCAVDCAQPFELCDDGIDGDCDGAIDCDDLDCSGDPLACPGCAPEGTACTENAECCSDRCRGPAGRRTCN